MHGHQEAPQCFYGSVTECGLERHYLQLHSPVGSQTFVGTSAFLYEGNGWNGFATRLVPRSWAGSATRHVRVSSLFSVSFNLSASALPKACLLYLLRIGVLLRALLRSGHFGHGSIPIKLARATTRLKSWCRLTKRSVAFRKFSRDNLCLKSGTFPEMKAKGYDVHTLLVWLGDTWPVNAEGLDAEYTLLYTAASFMGVLGQAENFLSDEQAKHVEVVGEAFLKVWVSQAHLHPAVYRVRPKFHVLHHCVLEAAQRPSRRNVRLDSTWMDEDFMKKVSKIIRRTHRKTSPLTTLQRYLLVLKDELDISVDER